MRRTHVRIFGILFIVSLFSQVHPLVITPEQNAHHATSFISFMECIYAINITILAKAYHIRTTNS